ncbi:hypothetical protein LTR37_005025 [Vermiconidia calcicola]|uniref:Uncharacterized protein n=1 Tax=Vermiconidia calcicola TaxID=1690605 RepID=A0ACC3NKX6_9PEZI|nr:hypothetical protein LTR37_005025 [Vermiconidia calcicola]
MDTHDAIEADIDIDRRQLQRTKSRSRVRGQKAAELAKAGIETPPYDGTEDDADEQSPLLPPEREEDKEKPSWEEFADLPWYKRPSIFFVLPPFFLMACAFGGVITPKLNLILELICQRYMSEKQLTDPTFTMIPVHFGGGDNSQCRIPEVQSAVAQFTLWGSLIAGLLSAITSPKLGALSDRYGRKKILVFSSVGTILGELITIWAGTYPENFPVNMLILGYALDGLTGSFIVAMAISNSYATDCTPPTRRNVAFGYFHGCLFTGIALGPIIAGYIVKKTGKIVIVFWILTSVHLFFMAFITFITPESLSKKRQMVAREKHAEEYEKLGPVSEVLPEWVVNLRSYNLLAPLKVLWPTGPGSSPAVRRNLFLLAAVDTIMFGVAMGSMMIIVIYANYMFGWESFESGRFMTIVNSCRVFSLLIALPLLTRYVRPKPDASGKQKGCDSFDLNLIRFAVFFDTLGYVGYTVAMTGPLFTLSGAVAAVGGIAAPTLQAALTKHVPAEQTGQLLGASGLLHALARVVAPTVFQGIYAGTVKHYPQTVFVCLASTFGLAFGMTWFLRTNVYFDEDKAAEAADQPQDATHFPRDEVNESLPVIGSVIAAFAAIAAWFGLSSAS